MLKRSTADQAFLREMNLSAVLRRIFRAAPLSRAKLAAETGLNKSTVSSLVEDLIERKLVRETGLNSEGAGRPATLLETNADAGAVIAVELGVDFVGVALTDFRGGMLRRQQIDAEVAEAQQDTLRDTRRLIEETRAYCGERGYRVLGLSFAIPGTVDQEAGLVIYAPNLNWRNVPMHDIFAVDGMNIHVENDANAAAVAEHLFGAAQHARDFILVFAGVGLGGGVYVNNELYRGAGGYAGEIGHTAIKADPAGIRCRCGKTDCWEVHANQPSILRRVEAKLAAGAASSIPNLLSERRATLSLAIINEAADMGDSVAISALAEAGEAMGAGFAGLVNAFNPQKIILGGPISIAGAHLLPSITASMGRHAMSEIAAQTEIGISAFGPDASLMGAAAVVVDDILSSPTHVKKEVMLDTEIQTVIA
jgi:glucokinase-like ROK family protein